MITEETVKAALSLTEKRIRIGDWLSNGHIAIRGETWAALASETRGSSSQAFIEGWSSLPRVHISEVAALRIPPTTTNGYCKCHCGHAHTSVNTTDRGQAVFRGKGGSTIVQPAYADLLIGLAVFRDGSPECAPGSAMLLGCDKTSGDLVVTVMPVIDDIRKPGRTKP